MTKRNPFFSLTMTVLAALFNAAVSAAPETVPVGNPGNPADNTGFGAVPYDFRIGIYEVTNAEYAAFLNAVAKTDSHQLFDGRMGGGEGGIIRIGNSGDFSYQAKGGGGSKPVNFVTFESCVRYANWLTSGNSEAGAYTFEGGRAKVPDHAELAKQKTTSWVVASENEWYKAAYYDPKKDGGGYWPFAFRGGQAPPSNLNTREIKNVGSYEDAASPYGTFDQNGNLWEYNDHQAGNKVGLRGGSYFHNDNEGYLRSSTRYDVLSAKWPNYGFRVVALGGSAASARVVPPKPVIPPPAPAPEPVAPLRKKTATFYISASEGNDDWSGTAEKAFGKNGPWKTLRRASIAYLPGDQILLKRGDTWNDELAPKGSGTPAQPIVITGYGEGPKPIIDREDYNKDFVGIYFSDQGGFKIQGIEFANCMTGIYGEYSEKCPTQRNIWIEDCYFHDALKYQHYEDYPNRKIGLGICFFSFERKNRIVLKNIMVKNCVFRRLASGIWTNSPDNFNKNASYIYNFGNLVMDGCLFEEGYQWQQGIRGVAGGAMRNCVTHDIGRNFLSFNGVAGSMFFRCKDWLFENCEWGFISIGNGSGDGEAFDFEGNCDNMIMRNCLFHDTDGPGFLMCCYASDGHAHSKLLMENCVINGKSKRPIGLPRCAIVNTTDWNESHWKNCRFYLSKGEAVMRVMDPEKDKKTSFENCRVKDLSQACSSKPLAARQKAVENIFLLDFGKSVAVNEFRIKEKEGSSVIRYRIDYFDAQARAWKSCFNGRAIGDEFVAPVVQRRMSKARLVVIQTEQGKPALAEFAAFNDPLGEPWNVKRGDAAPNRVGK